MEPITAKEKKYVFFTVSTVSFFALTTAAFVQLIILIAR